MTFLSSLRLDPKRFVRVVVDDLLYDLGFERRRAFNSAATNVAVFALGVAAGVAVGLAVAPRTGQSLRHDIAHQWADLRARMTETFQSAAKRGERYNPPS